jgi:hypothetical protein
VLLDTTYRYLKVVCYLHSTNCGKIPMKIKYISCRQPVAKYEI